MENKQKQKLKRKNRGIDQWRSNRNRNRGIDLW